MARSWSYMMDTATIRSTTVKDLADGTARTQTYVKHTL